MHLDVRGHPLHTRACSVTLAARADARIDVHAELVDVRKRGFVPVGGDLQGSGVVHHMLLDAVVDQATGAIATIEAGQPAVAFEASALSGGESCRDPIARAGLLAGTRLDDGFGREVSTALGGPRGCSHLMALAHLLGSTVSWALGRARARLGEAPARPAGQRVFRRDLVVDGHEVAPGRLQLAVQLTDLLFAPAPALARPMDRFAEEVEVRALADVDLATHALTGLVLGERRRAADDLAEAVWRERADAAARVVGLGLGAGVTAALRERLGETAADAPVLDALVMLAPTLIQCAAALSEGWVVAAQASPSRLGMGGLPDSCYMWRRGGALDRARNDEGGRPPSRPGRSGSG